MSTRVTAGAERSGQFFGSAIALRALIRPLTNVGQPQQRQINSAHVDWRAVLNYAACNSLGRVPRLAARHLQGQVRLRAEAVQPGRDQGGDSRDRELAPWRRRIRADPRLLRRAINKVPAGATAFAHRNMLFSMQYYASPGSGSNLAALNRYYHSLRPYVSGYRVRELHRSRRCRTGSTPTTARTTRGSSRSRRSTTPPTSSVSSSRSVRGRRRARDAIKTLFKVRAGGASPAGGDRSGHRGASTRLRPGRPPAR